ncbi:MAG: J domain-containing protein, partial [Merismopedia sp. SIO2A8]|nr:J domain-containing protein [Merismopedia sp. SIO2A8]
PVGVDLGVKCFATCSDGSKYVAPQPYQKAKTKLGKQQWLSPRQLWEHEQTTSQPTNEPVYGLRNNRPAHEVLGVKPNASLADIRSAYRRVAHMNHPDKLSGLAPEFRQLAEQRMKIITEAYKTLSQQSRYTQHRNGQRVGRRRRSTSAN